MMQMPDVPQLASCLTLFSWRP